MTFLLAHLTDPHIGPLPRPRRRDLMGKRLTGYINWRGGRDKVHDMEALARLVDDMKAQKPDHIAMTGDVLNIGLIAEYPQAKLWLETLGDPRDVSFTPGNHDAYVRSTLPQLASTFAAWARDDDSPDTDKAHYPYLRVRDYVALIGLSSAVPTAPFIASGTLGERQLAEFSRLLGEARERGLARVVLIHHPPMRVGAPAARGLTDARGFEAVIREHGAELVLHGHNHRASVHHVEGPGGRAVPIVGCASASLVRGRARAAYHLFRFSKPHGRLRIEARARGLMPGGAEIGELGALSLEP
ncbi:MAG: metallophosphoesterase [Methylobacteriaceae bacterium]|nr:metallophosphoesterase [Methylobacteriaceae bacterium]